MLPTYKIMLIGNAKVGKTAIKERFCKDQFVDVFNHVSTEAIDPGFKVNVPVDGTSCRIAIGDTPPMGGNFFAKFEIFARKVDAFIFVYDIGERNSFLQIPDHIDAVETFFRNPNNFGGVKNEKDPLFMLVGNKCDVDKEKREVTQSEGEICAAYFTNLPFMEVSARLENKNVESMIITLAKAIRKREEEVEKKKVEEQRKGYRAACMSGLGAGLISSFVTITVGVLTVWFSSSRNPVDVAAQAFKQ